MPAPKHPWVSELAPRIYRLTLPASPTDAELEAYVAARERFAEHCAHRHAWVVDARALRSVSAQQRRRFAEHLEAVEHCDARWNAGSAIVLATSVARGVVTAITWLRPPRYPMRTLDSIEAARDWCVAQLSDRPRP